MTVTPLKLTDTSIESAFVRSGDQLVRELTIGETTTLSEVEVDRFTGDDLGDWWRAHLLGRRPRPVGPSRGTVRAVELFCGPGGLMLGFQGACAELGLTARVEAAVDRDAEAVDVYRRNHRPRVATAESVAMLVDFRLRGSRSRSKFSYPPEMVVDSWASLGGRVDVLLAGPPCEGHSNLNNHTRRDDVRNDLYLTVPAIAVALGARMVVIENVPAVVHDDTGVVDATVQLLVDAGYTVETGVLNAAAIGWAQRRSRFFLIASLDHAPLSLDSVEAGLASPERTALWAIGDLEDSAEDSSFMTSQPDLSEENRRRIDWLFDEDKYDLALAERPECHQDGTTYTSVYGRMHPDRAAQTITTGFMTPGRGRYVHPTRRRVLTPQEAARLQGFPDTYDFRPDSSTTPSKSQLAKWIGDAVPMPLGYAASLAVLGSDGTIDLRATE